MSEDQLFNELHMHKHRDGTSIFQQDKPTIENTVSEAII